MRAFWKRASQAPIWLTAIMTLVAGLPQFACGCRGENGQPPQSASTVVPTSSCCCTGCCAADRGPAACCQSSKSQASKAAATSLRDGVRSLQAAAHDRHAGPNGCVKISVTSTSFAVVASASERAQAPGCTLLFAVQPVRTVLDAGSNSSMVSVWQEAHSPPPVDMLSTLKRLVI